METCIAYGSHKFNEHAEAAISDGTYECLDHIKEEEESNSHENDGQWFQNCIS